ncbi:hypothetical protein NPIL_63691 [Nephila pilipes]|uniref:Uncharacterized protein n=1 Tax=Nephila pilipes TaxID=299642 RepID=A0A8X6PNN4_NEPPI|nr:hypothetical protein NPIL_63691 [Nephila pilipes]
MQPYSSHKRVGRGQAPLYLWGPNSDHCFDPPLLQKQKNHFSGVIELFHPLSLDPTGRRSGFGRAPPPPTLSWRSRERHRAERDPLEIPDRMRGPCL